METTSTVLQQLQNTLVENYRKKLEAFRIKKSTSENLIAGYKGGVYAGIHHTCEMLGVKILEDAPKGGFDE